MMKSGITLFAASNLFPSLLLQIVAIFTFPASFVPQEQSVEIFTTILTFSLFLSPLVYFTSVWEKLIIKELAFALRILVVLVVSIPLGPNRWPSFLLVLSVIVEASAFHGKLWALLIISTVMALDLSMMSEHLVWGYSIPALSWDIRLAMSGGYLIFMYYSFMLAQTQRSVGRTQYEKERLSETVERLSEAEEGFLSFASSAEKKSAESERHRLTREIHDTAGYTLTNIRMMMEAGLRNQDMSRVELDKLFSWTLEQSQKGLQDIRSILGLIRKNGDSVLRGVKSLMQVGSVFQYATGIEVDFEWGNVTERWLEGDRDQLVLRILQEGLTNAFRHGMATKVNITFFQDDHCVRMGIHDNGYGAITLDKGIGLSGMRERLATIGGEMDIPINLPGFQINIMIPFLEKKSEENALTERPGEQSS